MEEKRKITTLVLLQEGDKILLGLKKRGFGVGRWNGFGGKVELGETVLEAAVREMVDECGIIVEGLEARGVIDFRFITQPGQVIEVNIFAVKGWRGEPVETGEMKPEWYSLDTIPYSQMWSDDIHWLPIFLQGEKFRGQFLFDTNDQVLEYKLEIVAEL
ncbi:MAG: 8-oxo-dGTP diphosphatase [Candidatus Pacebacteria bacterium]|nr:8-oxo-dGTP diphosphatase [Candidatus Paceibacterota bacterium]